MRVRIGVGVGGGAATPARLEEVVEGLHDGGFDSLWCSEVLSAPGFDPLTALAYVAGRFPGTKVGTTALLPGRNLLRLAKQLATVDQLSGGHLLVTFVPGLPDGPEHVAVGLPPAGRGAAIEAALPGLRRLLSGEPWTGGAPFEGLEGTTLAPLPLQQPLDLWLGGTARSALERCGRLADGWLPSRCAPEAAAAGRGVVEQAAADAGRSIDPEHFGVSVAYARRPDDLRMLLQGGRRSGRRGADDTVPVGFAALRARLTAFVELGFSKFVVRPVASPRSWRAELDQLADAVADLQR